VTAVIEERPAVPASKQTGPIIHAKTRAVPKQKIAAERVEERKLTL